MNTHDIDIELPPLPSPLGIVEPEGTEGMMQYTVSDLQDYAKACARAAIEADRKRRGEVVVTKTPEGEIIAVTRQDDEGRILSVIAEAGSKRRGEPVYLLAETDGMWSETNEATFLWWKANSPRAARVLYTAPQPAESCASLMSNKTACGSANGDCDSQPAEPEPCFCDRMYPDSNPDASCGDCPTRDYKKPAEPVKVPSDDVHRDTAG